MTVIIILLVYVLIALVLTAWWERGSGAERWEATAQHAADRRLLQERIRERDRELRRLRGALRQVPVDPGPQPESGAVGEDARATVLTSAGSRSDLDRALKDGEIRVTETTAQKDDEMDTVRRSDC